jgi:hypothetical protein
MSRVPFPETELAFKRIHEFPHPLRSRPKKVIDRNSNNAIQWGPDDVANPREIPDGIVCCRPFETFLLEPSSNGLVPLKGCVAKTIYRLLHTKDGSFWKIDPCGRKSVDFSIPKGFILF